MARQPSASRGDIGCVWAPQRPWGGQGNRAGALGMPAGALGMPALPLGITHQTAVVLAGLESTAGSARLEVQGLELQGLILASTCTVSAFLTQQGCPASAEGLAGAPSHPARIAHTPRGTRPNCAVYKTAKWKPKDLSLIPPVKSSRFLLATSHLISISKSWPSSPDPAESRGAEA